MTALTLGVVYRLPLRQTEGFLDSLLRMMGLDLKAPDQTTLSRRNQIVELPPLTRSHDGPIHLIVDSTGLKILGSGEWNAHKYKASKKRRDWRKTRSRRAPAVVEQHIHSIDVINWVMGMHPVKVAATGGRSWMPLDNKHGNNYDHLTAEFTYPNGVVSMSQCRHFPQECYRKIGEMVIGAKGKSNCQDMAPKGPLRPKVQEHVNLVKSIRGQGPYINFAHEVAESTMTAIMARESAYSGQEITWEMIMKSNLELLPKNIESDPKLGIPAPPVPGEYKFV